VRTNRLAGLGIARTLQGVGLFPGLSVLENVMLGAQRFRRAGVASALLGLPRSDRDERALRERALRMLEELGCDDVAARLPQTLPYPVQKRVRPSSRRSSVSLSCSCSTSRPVASGR